MGRSGPRRRGRRISRAWLLVVPVALVAGLTAACGPIANVTKVVAGYGFSCALLNTGKVQCWGANGGELGDGTTANSKGPVEVVGLGGVTDLTAGDDFACAVTNQHGVYCWGHNGFGQLGNGTTTTSLVPVSTGLANVTQIDAGSDSACAVVSSGSVLCWGANNRGQIGDGTNTMRRSPTSVSGITKAASVSVGADSACATILGGPPAVYPFTPAKCWGANSFGLFGNNTTTDSSVPVTAFYNGFGPYAPQLVTVGDGFACFGLPTTRSYCSGLNDSGQLGDGTTTQRHLPVQVSAGSSHLSDSPSAQLTAGKDFACTSDSSGNTACWGAGSSYQLGNGVSSSSDVPVDVVGVASPASLSAGSYHACASLTGGGVSCWGANVDYEIGVDGTPRTPTSPHAESLEPDITSVSAGYFHSCVLEQGAVRCFGYDGLGNLGNGATTSRAEPVPVTGLEGPSANVVAVAAGGQHTCALIGDGTIRCWGLNDSGQLGNGTTTTSTTPVAVSGITNATAVAVGSSQSCALIGDGSVRCWGNDGWGQLGDGEPRANSSTPVAVSGITNATGIVAGESHTCALLADTTVRCWGADTWSQLGQDFSVLLHPPSYVAAPQAPVEYSFINDALTGVESLSAGADHTCARMSAGGVRCWGRNDHGQLGDGTNSTSFAPVGVLDSAAFTAVDAGAYHTCAVQPNVNGDTVSCWGADYSGQLGDGASTDRNRPATVLWLYGVTSVDAGGSHTCVVVTGETAKCWGRGEYGQLGNGSFANPVAFPGGVYTPGYRWVPAPPIP